MYQIVIVTSTSCGACTAIGRNGALSALITKAKSLNIPVKHERIPKTMATLCRDKRIKPWVKLFPFIAIYDKKSYDDTTIRRLKPLYVYNGKVTENTTQINIKHKIDRSGLLGWFKSCNIE